MDLRHGKIAKQRTKIVRLIDSPERHQIGVRPLLRPALADITAEFPLDVASGHRSGGESRSVVDLTCNSLSVDERRRQAGWDRPTPPGRESGVFSHLDLLHE